MIRGVAAVALALAVGLVVGGVLGKQRARDAARVAAAEALADSNVAWLRRQAKLRADAETMARVASDVLALADSLRRARPVHVPAPVPTGTASDSSAYWQARALDAEATLATRDTETTALRAAFAAEQRASAAFRLQAEDAAERLAASDSTLRALIRVAPGERKLLGFLPRPSKPVAGALGCLAGALVDRGDPLRGCGLGGAVTVVVVPTR